MLTIARQATLACTRMMALAAMAVIGLMALTIGYDVLARFAFTAPTDWAYPLNASGVLVATALTIPHLYATRRHISMDLAYRAMPRRLQRISDATTMTATAVLGLTLAVTAYRSMVVALSAGLTGSGTFSIPLWIPDAVLLLTGMMLVLVAVLFPPSEPDDSVTTPDPEPDDPATANTPDGAAK